MSGKSPKMAKLVRIAAGDSICTICPELGGSLIGWSVAGQDMLRPTSARAIMSRDPVALASFPLVPFSNRIGFAQFDWNGRAIDLEPNIPTEPHAIHGIGWKYRWEIRDCSSEQCTLSMEHAPDRRWPWAFTATQTIRVTARGLELKLEAKSLSHEAAPLAFGHHPYFDSQNAQLDFRAARVFMSDALSLPTFPAVPSGKFDFAGGGKVMEREIDHCYAGWDGNARICWDDRPYALDIISDMPAIVIYIPQAGNSFCVEPVPHINNAVNRPGDLPAMPIAGWGQTLANTIRLHAVMR